jgi:hypothetical protein
MIRRVLGVGRWCLGVALAGLLVLPAGAQDMPDPSMMHGRPLPAPELANGTVTVRVVREALGNNVPGQEVRIVGGGTTRTATTDNLGRAEFKDLPAGELRAEATVDGEQLVSQPFSAPASGGVRVALVAGLARAAERKKQEEAAAAAAPPTKGVVVLGGDSRIVLEFSNDSLFAFYLLDIVNNARTRVDIGGPLVIDLPADIGTASLMEGSSPSATIDGSRITVQGPFASGTTPVRVQFPVRITSTERTVTQTFPVALQRVIVGVEKISGLAMSSPQFAAVQDLPTENGPYLLGQGGALAAGSPLTITFGNLPLHSRAPRYIALSLAALIAGLGVWLSVSARSTRGREREALIARRDALLAELAQLERRHRDGAVPVERHQAKRQRLVSQLEGIYGELDETDAGPPEGTPSGSSGRQGRTPPRRSGSQGGGEGVAA